MDAIQKQIKAIKDHVLPPEQHGKVSIKMGERGGYNLYAKKGHPLDRYNDLTLEQHSMGMRIHNWAYISRIYAPSGMTYDAVGGAGVRLMSESQQIAWHNYFKVMEEIQRVHGQRWVHALRDVCVMGETLESRKELKWRERKVRPLAEVLQTSHDFWKKVLHPARLSDSIQS